MQLPTPILLLSVALPAGALASELAAPPAPPAPATADATAPTPTPAPTAAADPVVELPPVRVTADLWESPLATLPASVSVYDGAQLARDGVRHFGDLVDQIPNLTWTGGTSRPRYFQIRGVGENSQFEGETPDSAVAFQFDDIDLTGLGGAASTFDLQQVEVLRGPQAGAFGVNAAGGAVRLVSTAPTAEWGGRVETGIGSDALRTAAVAAGGTLTPTTPERVMVRFTAEHTQSDGFRRNAFLNRDTNARDEDLFRVRLTLHPSADWRWDATLLYADLDNGYDEFALDNNGRFTFSDQPGRDEQRTFGAALRGVYSGWQDARLTTITQGSGTESLYRFDADWTPDASTYGPWESTLIRERRGVSQELRLDSAELTDALGWIDRWTLGLHASRLDEPGNYADPAGSFAMRYRATTFSTYGQAAHDFTTRDRLLLGLRLERVRNESLAGGEFADTLPGGKLTYEHDFASTHAAYASVARGYKAGGVINDPRFLGLGPKRFDTETLWNYELGLRNRWAEDRVLHRATVFWSDRWDPQLRESGGFGGNFGYYADNAERAAVWGLEDELTWRFADGWTAYVSGALMDSDLERTTLANGGARGGELANVPSYGYTVGLRYGRASGWFGHAELVGRDDYRESNSHGERRSAYEIVNASLGYAWRGWTLTLWGKNLFDEDYEQRVFFFDNGLGEARYESKAPPRQVGVSAAYQF